jgi:hypothetical protein
MVVAGLHL